MVQKIKDAANILKAKLKKDDLQQILVQATSQQNWQTPTNILHQISNASFNYQKGQQILEFIWDKLKKKNSWRKILKTLNLVDFLLKNGTPTIVSNFKYQIYTFKTFFDYTHYSDNIDKAEGSTKCVSIVREKAKAIVELLQNEQNLQQQRNKAKMIRDRMSGITGGFNYGNYGSSKNTGDNNKSYTKNNGGYQNKLDSPFGDYSLTQSTLKKYKLNKLNQETKKYGESEDKKDVGEQTKLSTKKPFEQQPKKLQKPSQKPTTTTPTTTTTKSQNQKPITNDTTNNNSKVNQQQKNQNKQKNLLDDEDLLGSQQPQPITTQINTIQSNTNVNQQPLINQQTLINPIYETPVPPTGLGIQQQQENINFNFPIYSNPAQNTQPTNQINFANLMYTPPQSLPQQNLYMPQQQQQQNWNFNGMQQPYMQGNSMYGNMPQYPMYPTPPTSQYSQPPQQPITLSQQPQNQNSTELNGYQLGNNNQNIKWLNEQEKGLIDLNFDFYKPQNQGKKDNKSNNTNANTGGWEW